MLERRAQRDRVERGAWRGQNEISVGGEASSFLKVLISTGADGPGRVYVSGRAVRTCCRDFPALQWRRFLPRKGGVKKALRNRPGMFYSLPKPALTDSPTESSAFVVVRVKNRLLPTRDPVSQGPLSSEECCPAFRGPPSGGLARHFAFHAELREHGKCPGGISAPAK